MKRIIVCVLFVLFLGKIESSTQVRIETWNSITSMNNVNTSDIDSQGRIWAGCNGGIFVYNPADKSFKSFRNTEGLISLDISVIRFDNTRKQMIIGTSDGVIEIMDENFKITHITDIKSARFPNPIINDIIIYNNFAFIAGGFGITKFDLNSNVFLESIFRFGTFSENLPARDIHIYNNQLWVATESGIGKVSLLKEITNPNNWVNITSVNGLKENDVYSISDLNDTIYYTTKVTVGKIKDSVISTIRTGESWETFQKLTKFNNKLYYINGFTITEINGPGIDFKQFAFISGFNFLTSNKSLLVYVKEKGIGNFVNDSMTYIYPNTPASNLFQSMSLDPSGNLWTATDISPRGRGFAKYDGTKWNIFNVDNYPAIKSNDYYMVNAISDTKILFSNWGKGFMVLDGSEGAYNFTVYDTTNSPFLGISDNRSYVISGGAKIDNKGTLWTINYGENSTGPHLIALDKNNKFYTFVNNSLNRRRFFKSLAIDFNGTKWIGSSNGDGLMYYNDNNTLENISDDKTGIYNTYNSGIYDETQNSIVVDNDGYVWIGTGLGLNCIINPSAVLSGQNPIIRKITVLGNRLINTIHIDALNYKWIGTNEGVWVLNPDATEVVTSINSTNSYLLSDEIMSLTSNFLTGEVYIGTRKGLNIIKTTQIKPDENYNIKAYPQPFVIGKDKELVIEGLAINSDVRILTLDGNLVRKMNAEGKVIVWDGLTDSGVLAPSGIYLVSATSVTTDNKSYTKIAVINK